MFMKIFPSSFKKIGYFGFCNIFGCCIPYTSVNLLKILSELHGFLCNNALNHIYQVADSKREEFRKYLEKAGVLDAITKGKSTHITPSSIHLGAPCSLIS